MSERLCYFAVGAELFFEFSNVGWPILARRGHKVHRFPGLSRAAAASVCGMFEQLALVVVFLMVCRETLHQARQKRWWLKHIIVSMEIFDIGTVGAYL